MHFFTWNQQTFLYAIGEMNLITTGKIFKGCQGGAAHFRAFTCSSVRSSKKNCNKYPWVMLLHNNRHTTLHIITTATGPHWTIRYCRDQRRRSHTRTQRQPFDYWRVAQPRGFPPCSLSSASPASVVGPRQHPVMDQWRTADGSLAGLCVA